MRKILASAAGASLLAGGLLGFVPGGSTPAFADTAPRSAHAAFNVTRAPNRLDPAQADRLLSDNDVARGNEGDHDGHSRGTRTETIGTVTGTVGQGGVQQMFLSIVAQTIGIPETELVTDLASGQTLAQIAEAHNVSPQAVIDALVAAARAKVAAAVAAGQITQTQADQILATITQAITALVNGNGFPGFGGGVTETTGTSTTSAGAATQDTATVTATTGTVTATTGTVTGSTGTVTGTAGDQFLSIVAQTIGIPETELVTDLASGQTLAQIAQADNVSPQAVIDALVAAARAKLAAAVAAGEITQAQADQILAVVTPLITDLVNGTNPWGGPIWGGPPGNGVHVAAAA